MSPPLSSPLSLLSLPSLSLSLSLLLQISSVLAGEKTSLPNVNWDFSYPYKPSPAGDKNWYFGSATWYGFTGGSSGACGYPWGVVNNIDYAATPDPRFSNFLTAGAGSFVGAACGQCYQVKCIRQPRYGRLVFCKPGAKAVTVRITDYDVPGDRAEGWPNNHFDLAPRTFEKIAEPGAGIINIKWRRVNCKKSKTKWTVGPGSHDFWHDVVIYDTPGVGSVMDVWARPSNRNKWYQGQRTWGMHFTFLGKLAFDGNTKVRVTMAQSRKKVNAIYGQIN